MTCRPLRAVGRTGVRDAVRRRSVMAGIAVAMLLATGCGERSVEPPASGRLALGTWGGDNAAMIVTDTVTHVHVGCTFGDMPPGVVLDQDGRFSVDGSYVLRAYPIAVGPRLPAQFSGRVTGRTMSFAVAVNDTVSGKVVSLGPVTVVLNEEPKMGPCPICIVPKRMPEMMPEPVER